MVHADHDARLVHGFVVEDGRPWPHGWAEIGDEVVYCPTVGQFFDRDSYYQVLRAALLVVYTPQEAADHATREGGAGPWGDGNDAYLKVIAGLFGWFHTHHPDLLDWVQRMRACDASFAHDFDAAIPANLIALVYLLQDLERHPERWRDHEPGRVPWPYRLRVQNATYGEEEHDGRIIRGDRRDHARRCRCRGGWRQGTLQPGGRGRGRRGRRRGGARDRGGGRAGGRRRAGRQPALRALRLGLGERLLCERVDRSQRPPRLVGWASPGSTAARIRLPPCQGMPTATLLQPNVEARDSSSVPQCGWHCCIWRSEPRGPPLGGWNASHGIHDRPL